MSRNKTICQKYPSQKKSIYFHELNCVQKTAAVLTQVKEACRAAARATWKGWFNTFLSQNCPLLTHFWCLLELRKFKQRKMYFSSASTCLCSMCLTSSAQRDTSPVYKGTQNPLKGHSQLKHMRISYHFLADLHITRHVRETESEKRIRNTLNKTCRAELVTSRNRDYRLYSISEHSFFIYYWEFSDGFVQGKPNIDEYFWIRSSVEVRNDTESAWIIVEGSRSRKLDFPNICNLFHQFSKYI